MSYSLLFAFQFFLIFFFHPGTGRLRTDSTQQFISDSFLFYSILFFLNATVCQDTARNKPPKGDRAVGAARQQAAIPQTARRTLGGVAKLQAKAKLRWVMVILNAMNVLWS